MLFLHLFASLLPCAIALSFSHLSLHIQWNVPVNPLQRDNTAKAVAFTEPSAALSGFSRASRLHFVSIQRLAPVFPPVISAGIVQNLQFSCHL